jgi:hypothetical protein
VENSLHSFLVSIPIAIVLWALMLLALAVAVVLMNQPRDLTHARETTAPAARGSRAGRSRVHAPRTAAAPAPPARSASAAARTAGDPAPDDVRVADGVGAADGARAADSVRFADEPRFADDLRFADEVSVAAERAAATAARCRADWEAAERDLDAAWAAYQEADAAARRTWAATAFPLMSRRRKLGENADRERYLHHAATVACRQRELSIAQLNDVYAHRGWNPRLHPVVQEALLRNAIRENRFAAYREAQHREQAAWQQAEIAAEALRALRTEAAAAFGRVAAEQAVVDEFWWAEPWTTGELPVAA